jgi:hypothetical protein
MASVSVPGVHSWGNLHSLSVLGVLRWSPCHGDGLQTPFLLGHGVPGMVAHMRPQGCISSVFLRPVQHNFPTKSRLLVRSQLLTRLTVPSCSEGAEAVLWLP